MARRHCQLRVCDPKVFLLLPATPLAHRHARILRTIPVDHTLFCFTYPDLHHRLLSLHFTRIGAPHRRLISHLSDFWYLAAKSRVSSFWKSNWFLAIPV